MGLMRAFGRAGSLAVAGAAAGYLLRRSGLLGAQPPGLRPPVGQAPSEPRFVTQVDEPDAGDPLAVEVEPVPAEPEPEPEPEPQPEPADAVEETVEWDAAEVEDAVEVIEPAPAEEERPDVTAVVDDLLGEREGSVRDAEVVAPAEDARVAEAVRVALAEEPGLLTGPVDIEVEGGRVTLRGEVDRPEGIMAVERKTEQVPGVRELKSYLQLAGTPAPDES
jgi:hypothetical protein